MTAVLVGLLIGLASLWYVRMSAGTRLALAHLGMDGIKEEIERYLLTPGRRMPRRLEDLPRLESRDDPWGSPYIIQERLRTPPRIMSLGPDRTLETTSGDPGPIGDDIALDLPQPKTLPPHVAASRPPTQIDPRYALPPHPSVAPRQPTTPTTPDLGIPTPQPRPRVIVTLLEDLPPFPRPFYVTPTPTPTPTPAPTPTASPVKCLCGCGGSGCACAGRTGRAVGVVRGKGCH